MQSDTDIHTDGHTDGQTVRQTDRQTHSKAHRRTVRSYIPSNWYAWHSSSINILVRSVHIQSRLSSGRRDMLTSRFLIFNYIFLNFIKFYEYLNKKFNSTIFPIPSAHTIHLLKLHFTYFFYSTISTTISNIKNYFQMTLLLKDG